MNWDRIWLIGMVLFAVYCAASGYEPGSTSMRFGMMTGD